MSVDERSDAGDLVGTVLADRYRIVARLGEGAMGAVYLGEHLRIGRRDAIKVLREGMARDAEAAARFMRGARNVSAIRHPNVCTIYDFSDTADGLQFLAMEYVEGETLKDTLDREGRLDAGRAVAIAQQVAAALQAAHEAGIVHRDLKPGNIMVTRRPDGTDAVKVVDFDIAKGPQEAEGEEVTRLGFVVGTPEYMSPEQLMGERLDGRSDVYSLGIVLFRMLTGALPFRAATAQEIMVQRLTEAPLRLSDALPGVALPEPLERVVARSLARLPAERHESAAAFAADLAGAFASPPPAAITTAARSPREVPETVVAPRAATPSSGASGAAPAGLRRGVLMGAAAAALLVVVVGASALLRRGDAGAAPSVTEPPAPVARDPVPDAAAGDPDGSGVGTPPATDPAQDDPAGTRQPAPLPAQPPRTRLPGSVAAALERQLAALSAGPTPAGLRAIRDTATIAWSVATTRGDSATAAFTLAQAALIADDVADCARWARQASALGANGVDMLLQVCR